MPTPLRDPRAAQPWSLECCPHPAALHSSAPANPAVPQAPGQGPALGCRGFSACHCGFQPSACSQPSPSAMSSCRRDLGHIPSAHPLGTPPDTDRPWWSPLFPPATPRCSLCPSVCARTHTHTHTRGTRTPASLTCGLQEMPDAGIHWGYAATQCVGALRAERAGSGEAKGTRHIGPPEGPVGRQGTPRFLYPTRGAERLSSLRQSSGQGSLT